jgi:hypothetical protein
MVLVDDSARVPAGILAQAREVAAKIFRDIDVELVWVERDDVRSFVKVRLLTREMTDRMEVPRSTLGMAEGTQLAVVFYNRIEELSPRNEKDTGCMLGHVIAHEIGHLLLPGEAHSLSGIMQAVLTLQLANRGGLFFTTFQAHSIRAKLGAS